jgi:flavin-dependent dehydrogenase
VRQHTNGTRPTSDSYDTIVVGAGPAGIMAAFGASRRGSVLLVDSVSLPRDKSCGGMLHELTQGYLARFGELPEEIVLEPRHVNFRYVDWDRGIRKATALRFVNVDRAGFDHWLTSLLPASVEVIGLCPLVSFSQGDDRVTVTLRASDGLADITCANLVGADGARSTVRRALGIGDALSYVTLQDYVHLEGRIEPYFDCIYMRDIGDEFAYAYVVPKGDVAIVGSVFYPKTKRPGDKQDQVLDTLRRSMPQLGESLKREACAALYLRSTADTVPGDGRVLLAGEAGGFMSPTSGEGISYATHSGIAAGDAIAASTPDEALGAYAASVDGLRRDIRRRLRWLPFMESSAGKYLAGFVPTSIVSKVTTGL